MLFFSPALYKKEKIIFTLIVVIGTLLFLMGIYFSFVYILPITMKYLLSFGNESIIPMLSADKYFSFVVLLTLGIGAIFELPLLMVLLSKIGLINYQLMSRHRRTVIFIIFVITAVITPTPDAFTLCFVALPMVLLYEIGLFGLYIFDKIQK
ncbi:twin-arginine translocase subunit TatC [Caloramator sp. mosi_1]|nr:twin-arginine translocase subunit TatC [Caloramator sp. mosi_1]WDC85669.1 twin-arginine translocase subunit TatC [Caloramator sp. mosi_1]